MSVLVIANSPGRNTAQTRAALAEQASGREVADEARAAGAIPRRFGIGDGVVAINDEWESVEHFPAVLRQP